MKQAFFLLILISGFLITSKAQNVELPGEGNFTLKEVAKDTVYYITFKLNERVAGVDYSLRLSNPLGPATTAVRGVDYEYIDAMKDILISSNQADFFTIGILVKARNIARTNVIFELNLNYDEGTKLKTQKITFTIESRLPLIPKTSLPDTSKWSVRIVTGSNFDFFGESTFKNFAGDLSIWTPDLVQLPVKKSKKKVSLGLQAGFFNYRYFEADSTKGHIVTDKYLMDPTVTQVEKGTTKYVREVYALDSRVNFNTVGAYLNPILTINTDSKWFKFYISLHLEMLWRTEIQQYIKVPIRRDTAIINDADIQQGIVLQSYPGLRPVYDKKSFSDGFFGIGFPLKINIKNAFELYLAPTVGLANYETTNIITETRGGIRYRSFVKEPVNKFFALTKAQLTTSVSTIGLSLGGEFRRIFGARNLYSLYLGASLPLDKFLK